MSKAFHEQSSGDYEPVDESQRTGFLDIFPPAPEPDTELRRYRLLSPTAGIRVSPICFGSMSLGNQWTGHMGNQTTNQKQSEEVLDAFWNAGGNFIDTANNYQDEQSEHIIGEWMEKRKNRDEVVLATKFTTYPKNRQSGTYPKVGVNWCGNHKKNLRLTLDDSLRKLRTHYVDLLYVHWWDHSTSIPELMQSLNDVVRSGKVLYLGVSDTPAWIVSQANEYARQNGYAQFVIYQGLWNLETRDMERDIIPMCRNNGMGIAPWGVLGQGKFKNPQELESRAHPRGGNKPTEAQVKLCKVLQEIADQVGEDVHLAHVAMAWCRQMMTDCYPILGGSSIKNLKSNIQALSITLTPEQMNKLNEASPFDHGFPTGRFGLDPRLLENGQSNTSLITTAGHIKYNAYP